MKDFLFVYRSDLNSMPKSSPEQMQASTKRRMDWIGGNTWLWSYRRWKHKKQDMAA